ncbi:MAG TPA: PhoH family protein [Planctomycetaceae bacterium]|nr:phosphate starvation-inducible protein PhoH [Blastopirellula sp.]HAY81806.1 PhoH family protein [Planctomycetaceae bacterium]
MFEATLSLTEPTAVLSLFGARDQYLNTIRDQLEVTITHRDGKIRIAGDEAAVARATDTLEQLKDIVDRKGLVSEADVEEVLGRIANGQTLVAQNHIEVMNSGKQIKPRTPGQARYIEAVRRSDLVFAIGPAGTGKTYLAVALAVEALMNRRMRKIVLVRPAVEAGESLGFLPGDLEAKINPYLRPLLDALHEMISHDQIRTMMDQQVVEVLPLAYMRGRTLNDAFIILDEAQNTTTSQMKMFLTRMGVNSKIIVSGDTTQTDLPQKTRSGLIDALRRLKHIKGIREVRLTSADIVRHRLVQQIVRAYDSEADN